LSVVIDTSAWIEWFSDTPVSIRLAQVWPISDDIIVPTLVLLELSKWLLRLKQPAEHSTALINRLRESRVSGLDEEIALSAADLCHRHRLATADGVIYATAMVTGSSLLTIDAHFKGLPGVTYLPKRAG
jgi:predicted nucleic acid-binding protein